MLIMSGWLLVRREVAAQLMQRLSVDPVAVAVIGMIRVVVGLAIVIGHDHWGSALEVFISLLGWIILVSGLLTLFLPEESMRAMMTRLRYVERLPMFAILSFALGASLFVGGFTG